MAYRSRSRTALDTFRSHQPQTGPEVVDGSPAQDLDGDGLYEDVNGDGGAVAGDATVLINAIKRGDPAVMNNVEKFDFNGDGKITEADAEALFNMIMEKTGPGSGGGRSLWTILALVGAVILGILVFTSPAV